jgi:hypothetical protein
MRSLENDASAAVGGLGSREQPESAASDAKTRINFTGRCNLTGCMEISVAEKPEIIAARMHIISRRTK